VHEAGLTHGDIKADNIIIGSYENQWDYKGFARLIDFGTSTRYKDDNNKHVSQELKKNFVGNVLFNSASQLDNKFTCRRDDMLSIGLLLIFLVSELPYQ